MALNMKYSQTVEVPGRIFSCITKLEMALNCLGEAIHPLSLTSPWTCTDFALPEMASSSVVFPAPDGPMIAVMAYFMARPEAC